MRVSRPLVALTVLLAVVPAVEASAQAAARPVGVAIAGGMTFPLGDYAQDSKSGLHGLAYLQYEPASNVWGVRGEAMYHRADFTDDFLASLNVTDQGDLSNSVLYIGGSALLIGSRRGGAFTPYAIGGLGLYRLTATLKGAGSSIATSETETGFGFNGGAGVRLGVNTGAFLEVRYHQFSVTPEGASKSTYSFIPVTIGVRF